MRLDEEGWGEVTGILAEAFEQAEAARCKAEERLRETGEKGFPATFAMMAFESPPFDLRF